VDYGLGADAHELVELEGVGQHLASGRPLIHRQRFSALGGPVNVNAVAVSGALLARAVVEQPILVVVANNRDNHVQISHDHKSGTHISG